MPQADKMTFFPIVFWTFITFGAGYLFLNVGALYSFITGLKVSTKRQVLITKKSLRAQLFSSTLAAFPWLSI